LQEEICRRVSCGDSLITVCAEDHTMPPYYIVLQWMRREPDFSDAFRDAQRLRGEVLFEQAISIADDARNDWMLKNDPLNPGWLANGEAVARSKLRVDTRKWAASKLNPARFGDKLQVEGDPSKPLVVSVTHEIVHVVRQETTPVIEAEPDPWDPLTD
jgi:Bacteriophage Sf6, terminase small subunit-like